MINLNWKDYYRNIAHAVKIKSKDNNTKIGAVIVGKTNEIISTGYNSFPKGIDDNVKERQERPEKYYWFSHAEQNAIINAARVGVSTDNSIMYMTCAIPCTECAKAIINAGIVEIFCERPDPEMEVRWGNHTERSIVMFKEAGVKINFY
jgi:dCMP deaminase